jgi:hypothetical protein
MGVAGLFGFLEYYNQSKLLNTIIRHKNIGIDIFWFMHRCKGDIEGLKNSLSPFFQNSETCYFVFDGKVPEEKKGEKELQRAEREKMNKNIVALESQVLDDINLDDRDYLLKKIEQMKRENWTPRSEFINEVKKKCVEWHPNIRIMNAPFEADTWLVNMEQKFDIDFIVSNDSDLIVNGCINLIRPKILNGFVKIYDVNHIIHKIGCKMTEWVNLCELFKNYKGNDILVVYSWWRCYKMPEFIYYLYKDSFNIPDDKILSKPIHKKIKSISPSRR